MSLQHYIGTDLNGVLISEIKGPRTLLLHVGTAHHLGPEIEPFAPRLLQVKHEIIEALFQIALVGIKDDWLLCIEFAHHLHREATRSDIYNVFVEYSCYCL